MFAEPLDDRLRANKIRFRQRFRPFHQSKSIKLILEFRLKRFVINFFPVAFCSPTEILPQNARFGEEPRVERDSLIHHPGIHYGENQTSL